MAQVSIHVGKENGNQIQIQNCRGTQGNRPDLHESSRNVLFRVYLPLWSLSQMVQGLGGGSKESIRYPGHFILGDQVKFYVDKAIMYITNAGRQGLQILDYPTGTGKALIAE